MSELITGKEAKIAWANGENVLYSNCNTEWLSLNDTDFYSSIFNKPHYEFMLKPKSITIKGIDEDDIKRLIDLSLAGDVILLKMSDIDSSNKLYSALSNLMKEV